MSTPTPLHISKRKLFALYVVTGVILAATLGLCGVTGWPFIIICCTQGFVGWAAYTIGHSDGLMSRPTRKRVSK